MEYMRRSCRRSGRFLPILFDEIILPQLGRKRPEILMARVMGWMSAVDDLGHGQVMVTTYRSHSSACHPTGGSGPPGSRSTSWLSDAVTSRDPSELHHNGLNLPLSMTREEFRGAVGGDAQGVRHDRDAVISGHTGRYEGCEYPMIGGATVIGIGPKTGIYPGHGAVGGCRHPHQGGGHRGGRPVRRHLPDRVVKRYGEKRHGKPRDLLADVHRGGRLTAMEAGVREDGVTTMHDATSAFGWPCSKFARASGVGMTIDKEKIIVQDAVSKRVRPVRHRPVLLDQRGDAGPDLQPHKAKEVIRRLGDKGDTGEHGGARSWSRGMECATLRTERPMN